MIMKKGVEGNICYVLLKDRVVETITWDTYHG